MLFSLTKMTHLFQNIYFQFYFILFIFGHVHDFDGSQLACFCMTTLTKKNKNNHNNHTFFINHVIKKKNDNSLYKPGHMYRYRPLRLDQKYRQDPNSRKTKKRLSSSSSSLNTEVNKNLIKQTNK